MAVAFLLHPGELLELIADKIIGSFFPTGLGLFVGDGSHPKEKGFFGDIVELVVDPATQEDSLVAGERYEHEIVRRMRVSVEQTRCQQLLRLLEDHLLRLVLVRRVGALGTTRQN